MVRAFKKRDLSKPIYGMGLDLDTTSHHPGYDYTKGVGWNVKRGIAYGKKHHLSLLSTARQIKQLANVNRKRNPHVAKVYDAAAKIVFNMYNKK